MDPIMGIQTQAGAIRQEELTEANLVPVVIRLTERVGQIEDVLRALGDIEELHERLTQVEVSVSAMLRYGKKTDQDVFEPTMWKKEVRRLSGGQEINLDISYDA